MLAVTIDRRSASTPRRSCPQKHKIAQNGWKHDSFNSFRCPDSENIHISLAICNHSRDSYDSNVICDKNVVLSYKCRDLMTSRKIFAPVFVHVGRIFQDIVVVERSRCRSGRYVLLSNLATKRSLIYDIIFGSDYFVYISQRTLGNWSHTVLFLQ